MSSTSGIGRVRGERRKEQKKKKCRSWATTRHVRYVESRVEEEGSGSDSDS